jgi:hypothetical protein
MPRTSLFAFALLALPSFAHASPPPPTVEDLDPQRPDPPAQVVVEDLSRAPNQPHPALDPSRGRMVGTFGFFGSGFDPRARRWGLGDSEIGALDGAPIPDAMLADRARYGGVAFGSGFRPLSWLRLPELRVAFGGGDHPTRWTPIGEQGLEGAITRSFLLRLELLAGVEVDLGPITPFARVYGGVGMHSAKLKVRDAALGALGSERVVAFAGDVGVELGFDVFFTEDQGERVGLRFAYRRGLVGAEGHGAFVGLAIQGKRPS